MFSNILVLFTCAVGLELKCNTDQKNSIVKCDFSSRRWSLGPRSDSWRIDSTWSKHHQPHSMTVFWACNLLLLARILQYFWISSGWVFGIWPWARLKLSKRERMQKQAQVKDQSCTSSKNITPYKLTQVGSWWYGNPWFRRAEQSTRPATTCWQQTVATTILPQ